MGLFDRRFHASLKLLLVGCTLLIFAGCAHIPAPEQKAVAVRPAGKAVDLNGTDVVRAKLQAQHSEWAGARYRLGGLSKSGVDCSGFVYITFRERLGLAIPRTTQGQINIGRAVTRSALRPGDLVFFRTGLKARHVGIYVGGDQFLHASSSRGVMLSSLSDPYWREKYWLARRPEV